VNAFPFSETDPIVYAGPPPKSADVVIIGGGIIGITTALYLAQQNVAVTVLEKKSCCGRAACAELGPDSKTGQRRG
jgi:monoamine oxidase